MLLAVRGVDVELVVVDAHPVVWVAGAKGDLEGGGEEVWGGDGEGENGGVLEDEVWLGRLEHGPEDQESRHTDRADDDDAPEDSL